MNKFCFIQIFRDSAKRAELDECFSERYTDYSEDELSRQLEIHLSDGNFQSE
jgi:hypothetical protein